MTDLYRIRPFAWSYRHYPTAQEEVWELDGPIGCYTITKHNGTCSMTLDYGEDTVEEWVGKPLEELQALAEAEYRGSLLQMLEPVPAPDQAALAKLEEKAGG